MNARRWLRASHPAVRAKAAKTRAAFRPPAKWLWARRRARRWMIKMPATPPRNQRLLRLARRVKGFFLERADFLPKLLWTGELCRAQGSPVFLARASATDLIYSRYSFPNQNSTQLTPCGFC